MDPLTVAIFFSIVAGPIALVTGLVLFPWRSPDPQRRRALILLAPPIVSFLWGLAFAVRPGYHSSLPVWPSVVPWLSLVAAALFPIILPCSIGRKFRLSSFALAIAGLAATFFTSFGALMAVTGDYI